MGGRLGRHDLPFVPCVPHKKSTRLGKIGNIAKERLSIFAGTSSGERKKIWWDGTKVNEMDSVWEVPGGMAGRKATPAATGPCLSSRIMHSGNLKVMHTPLLLCASPTSSSSFLRTYPYSPLLHLCSLRAVKKSQYYPTKTWFLGLCSYSILPYLWKN